MYIPDAFREDRPAVLHEIIRRYGFATLVSQSEGSLIASQLPFLLDAERNVLRSHMARANPQWKELGEREVMVIFQGPHAYISPSSYETKLAVPTWNYVTVHAYGTGRLIEDEAGLRAIVAETVSQYESGRASPWAMPLPEDYVAKMLRGIVGFEIEITRIEGKLKLSQNRPAADLEGAIAGLQNETDPIGRELSEWMRWVGKPSELLPK
jgi:transcriptional regulator